MMKYDYFAKEINKIKQTKNIPQFLFHQTLTFGAKKIKLSHRELSTHWKTRAFCNFPTFTIINHG